MRVPWPLVVLLLLGVACTPTDAPAPPLPGAPPADTTGGALPSAPPALPGAPSTEWVVTDVGAGPVRYGMTAEEARRALGGRLTVLEPGENEQCYHIVPEEAPEGVAFMVVEGRIARVDVFREASVATREGARIGDPEARILELYGPGVEVSGHRYVEGGHYLSATRPATDSTRFIFETDGQRVTDYRAGLLPPVRWVEGCS